MCVRTLYNFIRRHHDYVIVYLFVQMYVHLTNGPKRSLDGIGASIRIFLRPNQVILRPKTSCRELVAMMSVVG